INRRFQLKYTLIVVFLAAVIATVLGILLLRTVSENTQLALGVRAAMEDQAGLSQAEKALVEHDREVMLYLVACLVGLVLAITLLGIFVTHKVAGPLFVMTRYLNNIKNDNLRDVRNLRKGDDLVEFFETFE